MDAGGGNYPVQKGFAAVVDRPNGHGGGGPIVKEPSLEEIYFDPARGVGLVMKGGKIGVIDRVTVDKLRDLKIRNGVKEWIELDMPVDSKTSANAFRVIGEIISEK